MVSRALCGGSSRSNFSPLLSPCSTETLHPVQLFSFLQASLHPSLSILTSLHDQDPVLCWSSHLPILCSIPALGKVPRGQALWSPPPSSLVQTTSPQSPRPLPLPGPPGGARQTHLLSGELLTWCCPENTPQSELANQELKELSQLHRLPFSVILEKDLPFQEGSFL